MEDSYWLERPVGAKNERGFVTCVRDMARVGLLVQAQGHWAGQSLFEDTDLFLESVQPSTPMKPTYGHLWWLNSNGQIIKTAPHDLISAQGSKHRRIWIAPSLDLVVARAGTVVDGGFFNLFWALLTEAAP